MRLATTIVLVIALGARVAAAQPPDSDAERQRTTLYKEGLTFADQGRWADAVDRFRRVIAIRSAPRALFTLGQAEEKLGELATAQRTYQRALADARDAEEYAVVDAARQSLRDLDPRVPHLVLRLDASSAAHGGDSRATVDGQPAAVGQMLALDPGGHDVLVQAPGTSAFSRRVELAAGSTASVDVHLESTQVAPSPPPHDTTAFVAPASHAPSRAGPIVLGAAGVAAGVTGIVLRLVGQSNYDSATTGCQNAQCSSQDATNRGNDARTLVIAGTVFAAVGAAMVVGAGTWWFLQTDGTRTTIAMRVSF